MSKTASYHSLANVFDLPAFVVTQQVQQVADLCHALRQTRTLGTLVGLPGVGKTWALQYVAQQEPEPVSFDHSPIVYTSADVQCAPRDLLVNILNCLGPDYRASVSDMARLVCCWIHRRRTELIILDEAMRLDKASWELIQDIHDRTHCAFLFVGELDLPRRLRGNIQLHNRISLSMELAPYTYDELYAFVTGWQKVREREAVEKGQHFRAKFYVNHWWDKEGDAEMMKEVYRVTLGNLRRTQQFIEQAERVASVNGHVSVRLETIQAVAALFASNRF